MAAKEDTFAQVHEAEHVGAGKSNVVISRYADQFALPGDPLFAAGLREAGGVDQSGASAALGDFAE